MGLNEEEFWSSSPIVFNNMFNYWAEENTSKKGGIVSE
jgi:hypothetical protein